LFLKKHQEDREEREEVEIFVFFTTLIVKKPIGKVYTFSG